MACLLLPVGSIDLNRIRYQSFTYVWPFQDLHLLGFIWECVLRQKDNNKGPARSLIETCFASYRQILRLQASETTFLLSQQGQFLFFLNTLEFTSDPLDTSHETVLVVTLEAIWVFGGKHTNGFGREVRVNVYNLLEYLTFLDKFGSQVWNLRRIHHLRNCLKPCSPRNEIRDGRRYSLTLVIGFGVSWAVGQRKSTK